MRGRFQTLLQGFFTERLLQQRRASPHTISSYRDTFRLLLKFAADRIQVSPTKLQLEDISVSFIGEFLTHLEMERGNKVSSRNIRLAAIRSFFRYVALQEPAHALSCQRILAIPNKRDKRRSVVFLEPAEVKALLDAPSASDWIGRRDRTLLLVAVQTGLRVSELTGLRCESVVLGVGAHVRCEGKGRKERSTPLRDEARAMLGHWLQERAGLPHQPLFATRQGRRLSSDAVARLVSKHSASAAEQCFTLHDKRVTPHVLRHTAAMDLMRSGVDRSVIALWLGHESLDTTQIYLHADIRIKEAALARTSPVGVTSERYLAPDPLLAFLEGL